MNCPAPDFDSPCLDKQTNHCLCRARAAPTHPQKYSEVNCPALGTSQVLASTLKAATWLYWPAAGGVGRTQGACQPRFKQRSTVVKVLASTLKAATWLYWPARRVKNKNKKSQQRLPAHVPAGYAGAGRVACRRMRGVGRAGRQRVAALQRLPLCGASPAIVWNLGPCPGHAARCWALVAGAPRKCIPIVPPHLPLGADTWPYMSASPAIINPA